MTRGTSSFPEASRFMHDAMNTTFQLRLTDVEPSAAHGMARECFDHLDYLESRLSRFIEGSDISRINHLQAGETLYISEACHECLLISLDAHARTHSLFDITLGSHIAHRKSADTGPLPPLSGSLIIHPDIAAVTCQLPGREIDLGGVGKGYALDQLRQILVDWGAPGGLLTAGASSMLAFGPDAWPIDLAADRDSLRLSLTNHALSASGTGIQGGHIIHPGGNEAMPAQPANRVWVTASTAALAEIWSTALILIEPDGIPKFIAGETTLSEVHIERHGCIGIIPR